MNLQLSVFAVEVDAEPVGRAQNYAPAAFMSSCTRMRDPPQDSYRESNSSVDPSTVVEFLFRRGARSIAVRLQSNRRARGRNPCENVCHLPPRWLNFSAVGAPGQSLCDCKADRRARGRNPCENVGHLPPRNPIRPFASSASLVNGLSAPCAEFARGDFDFSVFAFPVFSPRDIRRWQPPHLCGGRSASAPFASRWFVSGSAPKKRRLNDAL